MSEPLPIDEGLVLPAEVLSWEASRAPGPGGQKVNKTSTKVTLRLDLPACDEQALLPAPVLRRLRALAASRLDREGRLVVRAWRHRTQGRNLEEARDRLVELIRAARVPPKPRKKTKPSRASKRRRLEAKKRQSERKQARRRPHDD
ncbi:MAG: alternative ribosome rescue aminoacyl-tRNA hydrolase ArfB [Deltaproteobacteria bacterium]|nr:alternative ribosome rescue aminoacyl-tRNA hydrolase ArfB [Deltaproteobacteria bacterium]